MRLALTMFLAMSGAAAADAQSRVSDCWVAPREATADPVEVVFEIDETGQLTAMPTSPEASSDDASRVAMGEAGIRAVRRCAPYQAPAGKHRVYFPAPPEEQPTRA